MWDVAGREATRFTHRNDAGPTRDGASTETTTFSYDPDGNQTAVTDARGHSTTYTYDLLGRQISMTRPRSDTEAWTTAYRYDPVGNRTATIEPPGIDTSVDAAAAPLVVDGTTEALPAGRSEHTAVTLTNGATLTVPSMAELVVSGSVSVCATCTIEITPAAGTGGPGSNSSASGAAGTGPGGGLGGKSHGLGHGGGGGGASHATAGANGTSGSASGGAAGPVYGRRGLAFDLQLSTSRRIAGPLPALVGPLPKGRPRHRPPRSNA